MNRRHHFSRILLMLNSLSLDAPLVAVCWLDLCSRLLSTSVPAREFLLLFFVTWLAYAGDRLLDSLKLQGDNSALVRHRFASCYQQPLGIVWVLTFVLTVLLALLWIDMSRLIIASFLAAGVVSYFAICFYSPRLGRGLIPRELVVGCVFVVAVLFFPLSQFSLDQLQSHCNLICSVSVLVCSLAFLNCLGISCWEYRQDVQAEEVTLATRFPGLRRRFSVVSVFVCGCNLLCFYSLLSDQLVILLRLSLGVSLSCLSFIILNRSVSGQLLKPVLADIILLIPWLTFVLW